MAGQLPKEFYMHPPAGGADAVEYMCAQATNRPTEDVVAIAVDPINVARAAELLFGTGIGIVSTLEDPTEMVDQARRSVAQGATEIALPRMVLDQAAMLQRLRSHLGAVTPVTIGLTETDGRLDLSAAEYALRLGADYVSFSPPAGSPTATNDITSLLSLAHDLQFGGVKIAVVDEEHTAAVHERAPAIATTATRLRVPISPAGG